MSYKTLAGHLVTALATVALVLIWQGERPAAGRRVPVLQVPGRPGRAVVADRPRPAERYVEPTARAPALPAEILRRADADEQINIRVYQGTNRGVVNITTAATDMGLFGDETTAVGSGSGFFFDDRGHILTNYHVVADADQVQVTLFDGSTHDAEVIGKDPSNDVAIVRVQLPKAKVAPLALGDSSKLLVGQKVLALGNPFGLERTLTTGIISSLERSMRAKNGRTIKGIIQTDAAINPGNSGGPLLNARGEVIGLTTAIISQVGQSAGIGFAVPINTIHRILKPLIEHGHVIRADLGLKRVYSTDQGLYIIDLVEGGPADRAGLHPMEVIVERLGQFIRRRPDPESADLIVAVDGHQVRSVDELLNVVEAHTPGDVVKVTVIREGKMRDVPVKLGAS